MGNIADLVDGVLADKRLLILDKDTKFSSAYNRGMRVRADTSEEADRVHLDLIRLASPTRRLEACLGLSRSLIALSRAALRRRFPACDEHEVELRWVEIHYGSDLAARVRSHLTSHR